MTQEQIDSIKVGDKLVYVSTAPTMDKKPEIDAMVAFVDDTKILFGEIGLLKKNINRRSMVKIISLNGEVCSDA